MTQRPIPAVMLEHLRKLYEAGQPVHAALPEAARLVGYDLTSVLEAWVGAGRGTSLSTFFEGRLAASAVAAIRDAEDRGDVTGALDLAQTLHAVDDDGCAPYSW